MTHQHPDIHPAAWLAIVWITIAVLSAGCGHRPSHIIEPERLPSTSPPSDTYRNYLAENQVIVDRIYGNEYTECQFEVNGEGGTVLIQTLIDPESLKELAEKIIPTSVESQQIKDAALRYIETNIRYRPRPDVWPTISETLLRGEADCKGRSLLLLSLLLVTKHQAYAAISNGHMWVVVQVDGHWQAVETDPDVKRKQIYESIPGFYERPLFKVYSDRALKRLRR